MFPRVDSSVHRGIFISWEVASFNHIPEVNALLYNALAPLVAVDVDAYSCSDHHHGSFLSFLGVVSVPGRKGFGVVCPLTGRCDEFNATSGYQPSESRLCLDLLL